MVRTIVPAWHGTYLVDEGSVVREARAPTDAAALADRQRLRAGGTLTPEEESLLLLQGKERWRTRDRRLVREGVVFDPTAEEVPGAVAEAGVHRDAVLRRAEDALAEAWDPSVDVEEAVRVLRDLDRALNLLGERVASWATLSAPELEGESPIAAARALAEGATPAPYAADDPAVAAARRRLAELLIAMTETRMAVDQAVKATVPVRAPNLHRLLGPELAARLVAQAGGLDRLARLPASTVQVLGAERAFFEHLRGRAPPPRHGLLFLHPAVQSAPRGQRGKLARALAAKVAIAARLDRAGAEVNPALAQAFEARRAAIRTAGPGRRRTSRGRGRSAPPLDGTAGDR
jgi:nucleolar protein 56